MLLTSTWPWLLSPMTVVTPGTTVYYCYTFETHGDITCEMHHLEDSVLGKIKLPSYGHFTVGPDGTKIVWTSDPLPNDAIVVPHGTSPELVAQIQRILAAPILDRRERQCTGIHRPDRHNRV